MRDESELAELEALHRVIELYVWLSWRFEVSFSDREAAIQQQTMCSRLIDEGLHNLGAGGALRASAAKSRTNFATLQGSESGAEHLSMADNKPFAEFDLAPMMACA